MGAFNIALIPSVPGTNLRICAFLQVVCAVETEFLPLCASWPEQNIQVGLSKPQKRHFYTVSASCVVITSGRKIAAQRKVTDKKSGKRKSEKNRNATKKTRKRNSATSGAEVWCQPTWAISETPPCSARLVDQWS